MQTIPKIIFQTQLNEWNTIEEQIERSKIKRYPYKLMLGESLTKYLVRCLEDGLSSSQSFNNIINTSGVKMYLFENPQEVENFKKNLWISICARYSESKSYIGRGLKV